MEDNYLDKKLKDILENPPPFNPNAASLSNMKKRLDESEVKSRRGVWGLWWLIPLFLLPFLLGSFFFFNKYQDLNQKFNELNIQLTQLQKDTINKNYVTYQYDTIYNTVYKDIIVERHFEKSIIPPPNLRVFYPPSLMNSNLSGKPSLTDFLVYGSGQNLSTNGLNLIRRSRVNSLENTQLQKELMEHLIRNEPVEKLGLKVIDPYTQFNNLEENLNNPDWEPSKPKVNPMLYFIPKGINAGGSYSPILSGTANSKKWNGRSLGLKGSLEFYGDIEMEIGLERLSFGQEIKDLTEIGNFPIADPENTNDGFNELKANFSYLSIPIILKKYFRSEKDFQPFVGVGFVAQRPLKQSFKYEYIRDVSGQDYYNALNLRNGDFGVNNLRAKIGFKYAFLKHFSAHTEFMYHQSFNQGSGEYFKLKYFGGSLGLKYHFN